MLKSDQVFRQFQANNSAVLNPISPKLKPISLVDWRGQTMHPGAYKVYSSCILPVAGVPNAASESLPCLLPFTESDGLIEEAAHPEDALNSSKDQQKRE